MFKSIKEVAEKMTAEMVKALSMGKIPWHCPYVMQMPANAITKHVYTGMNSLLLLILNRGNHYMTFKQAASLGGYPRKGYSIELLMPVFKKFKEEKDGKQIEVNKLIGFKSFWVWSTKDIDKLNWQAPQGNVMGENDKAERIIEKLKEESGLIVNEGRDAYYVPALDQVTMPAKDTFKSLGGYYATLFHEVGHWNASRHGKQLTSKTNIKEYSLEELVAELFAQYMLGYCGLVNDTELTNSQAYIQGWIKHLEQNPDTVMKAASQAFKRFKWILEAVGESLEPEKIEEQEAIK